MAVLTRRGFLEFLAAPAIVRASSLMPIRALIDLDSPLTAFRKDVVWTATRFNRLPLPFVPLYEGVAPTGETLTIIHDIERRLLANAGREFGER